MASTVLTKYMLPTEPVHVTSKSVSINIGDMFVGEAELVFVFARSAVTNAPAQSMYMLNGISWSYGLNLEAISKGTYGPTMSLGGTNNYTLTITFNTSAGGWYSFLPVFTTFSATT